MVKDITFDISNMQEYIQFRKKCDDNYVIIFRNYTLPLSWKYNIRGATVKINSIAMQFQRIPFNLIEDSIGGNFNITLEELIKNLHKRCKQTSENHYRELLGELFAVFPEGIIIKRVPLLYCSADNVVLWKPKWISDITVKQPLVFKRSPIKQKISKTTKKQNDESVTISLF